jgi:hypothetical protein
MKKMNPARTATVAASLGLALAMGAHASPICSHSGYPGEKYDFDYAWHANAKPVVEKSLHSAKDFGKLLDEWMSAYGSKGNGGLQSLLLSLLGGVQKDGYGSKAPIECELDGVEPAYVPKVPETPAVPEPTTAALVVGGLLGMAALARRKKS